MTLLPEPHSWGPLTRTDLVRYAGASGDFNPIHHDVPFARATGLPDVMAQGMYSAGLVATALERWFGQGCLLSYRVRFRAPVWPGDRLVARCEALERLAGVHAKAEVILSRADDEVVLAAAAQLRLSEKVTP